MTQKSMSAVTVETLVLDQAFAVMFILLHGQKSTLIMKHQ